MQDLVEQFDGQRKKVGKIVFLSSTLTLKQTWNMVRKISGKHASSPTKFLNTPAGTTASRKEIADTLGETFAKNSSTDNYTEEFKKFKSAKEKSPINFASQNTESYNKPLTVEETGSYPWEIQRLHHWSRWNPLSTPKAPSEFLQRNFNWAV